MNFDKEAAFAERIARKSGKLLLEYFEQEKELVRHAKGVNDYATEADLAAEKFIIDAIKKRFPGHSVISEEMGQRDNGSEFKWIIDPLDGTRNFASRIPVWGTMITLQHRNEIALSVIFLPVTGGMCVAMKGKGTLLNGKKCSVSGAPNLVYLCSMKKYNEPGVKIKCQKLLDEFHGRVCMINCVGAGAVLTASGQMDGVIGIGVGDKNLWDFAPAYLAIKEAGGLVTDLNGNPWTASSKDFIAASPKLHSKIMHILK